MTQKTRANLASNQITTKSELMYELKRQKTGRASYIFSNIQQRGSEFLDQQRTETQQNNLTCLQRNHSVRHNFRHTCKREFWFVSM